MAPHFHSWHRVTENLVGHEISVVVWTGDKSDIILGSKQLLATKIDTIASHAVALHCWRVVAVSGDAVTLMEGPHSHTVPLPLPSNLDFSQVSEVCAGVGGTMSGAVQVGFRPLVCLDQSPLSCELLRLNNAPIVLQGDLQNLRTLARFHLAHLMSRNGLLAGFPCQPFCTLGWSLAFRDPRNETFQFILDLAWLTQAAFMLLECVVGAGSNPQVRALLNEFCEVRGFRMTCAVLHLDHALPCRRTRWWCLLYPAWLPELIIPDLPRSLTRRTLQDIFPFWPVWTEEEELELKLDSQELAAYGDLDLGYRLEDRLLNMEGQCPTLLHSMGNVLRACPCHCRGPISFALLRAQGLHGVVVKSIHPSMGFRHLHPMEAALLLGLPATLQLGPDLRGMLCQLGQVASPIQSHLMLSHFWTLFGLIDRDSLPQLHEEFLQTHVRTHVRQWTPPATFWNRAVELCVPEGQSLSVRLSGPTRCLDLLRAEAALGRDVDAILLQDVFGPLGLNDWVLGSRIELLPLQPCQQPDSFVGGGLSDVQMLRFVGLDDLLMTREGLDLLCRAGLPSSRFLAPRNLAVLLDMWPECAHSLILCRVPVGVMLHGFFLVDQHWIYFNCIPSNGLLLVHLFDGLALSLSPCLVRLFHLFRGAWGLTGIVWAFHSPIPQRSGFHCGAIALLTLGTCLGLWTLPTEQDAKQMHFDLLMHQPRHGLGSSDEDTVLEWLITFLPSKGVPPERAPSRAKLALQKLGLSTLRSALAQKDPWRALKQAGSVTGRPFQWVTYEELQLHVAARSDAGPRGSKSTRAGKPRPQRNDPSVALSPDTVTLYPTSFTDDHEDAVQPITFPEVEANARGICVVTTDQAMAFQQLTAHLSTDALAVVSIGALPDFPRLTQKDILWPALYLPTKEPILVKGTLLQLGDLAVTLAKSTAAPTVTTLDTEVVRIAVFKDVFSKDWQQLIRGPVKFLLSLLTPLQACPDSNCDGSCKFFHAACDEEVTNPVLDVWSWRWTNLDNKQVQVDQATVFSVFVRVPRSALRSMLSVSGWFGIFLEPRPASKQGPHPAYAVIWLPKSFDLTAALDFKRRHDVVLGIARMQMKLGLRVLKRNEDAVMELVHPGRSVPSCPVESVYEVGPLPHGLSQQHVNTLLQAWTWTAKALRSSRSVDCGQYWEVGTACDPPAAILHTTEGSVTVTCKKSKERGGQSRPMIQASTRTEKHMQSHPSASVPAPGHDPWLTVDPWKHWSPSVAVDSDPSGQEVQFTDGRAASSHPVRQKLAVLEERLMQQVDQRLAAQVPPGLTAMETDADHARDAEITELKAQNAKFETWFTDIGSRFGKALHPGPSDVGLACTPFGPPSLEKRSALHLGPASDADALDFLSGHCLAVGTANVAGLSNKVPVLEDLPAGVWSLTETHLTAVNMNPVRMAIKQMGRAVGRSLRTVFGAPAPCRTVDSSAGTWTGVCTVSDYPSASVEIPWPDGIFASGRVLVSSHFVGATHLVVGTVYGAAQSPSFRDPLGITQSLLRAVADEVVFNCRGPRCIMGDFNCNLMQFPEMDQWRSLGWQEIQVVAQHLHHKPVEPTCKQVTVRDFMWCSPELLQYFQSTLVLPGVFPDHAAVGGVFRFPGCGGRGQHLKRQKRPHNQPAVKPSRPGEECLRSAFPNKTVIQHFRQLRRLQSLVHSCRNGLVTPSVWTYQSQCWSAILRASGFRPSFAQWWHQRPVRLQSSPCHIAGLPCLAELESIYHDFRLNFRHLESWHAKQRSKLAQVRRETSMKDLFRSMKPPGPEPLDFLCESTQFAISEVALGSGAVLLDGVPDFSLGMWDLAGESIHPIPFEPSSAVEVDRAWCLFESDRLLMPGMTLTRTVPVVHVPDIHRSLLDFWAQRWQALTEIPEQAWTRIFSFVRHFVPRMSLPCPVSTPDAVRAVFRSGAGLRQVALMGHVTCLQKKLGSFAVANYRPVVVFSLWYRLWGCLRARHYLAQLEQVADFPAFGFLTGRGCKDVVFVIQAAVESALKQGTSRCGALFDIEKCFNCLPREPLMFLAEWFGLDAGVIHAWKAFLRSMHRSFVVHQMPSETILSNHGLPEGDSMSCIGMVLLNFSYHFYLHHFQPQLVEISYVDNLQLMGEVPGQIIAGTATLQCWADMFRLVIDARKSSCWAVNPRDRDALQALGLPVVSAGADLGASMIYGASHRNRVLQDRVLAVKPYWKKLRSLKVSAWHKLLLITMALLPRALHLSNLTFLGGHWFTGLRTEIMRALKADRAGANPLVRVSLIYGLETDPEFYDGWRTFHDLVFYVQRNQFIRSQWTLFCGSCSAKRTYGPFDKFVRLLHQLGWILEDSDQVTLGPGLCLSLSQTDLAVWKPLATWHWRQSIAVRVSSRNHFADLDGINYSASFCHVTGLDKAASELLNCIKDGTFYNGVSKAKFDLTQQAACSCGLGLDNTEHRALVCPYYSAVLNDSLWDGSCVDSAQPEFALAGWSVVSADLERPIGIGLLPGVLHTSNRCELWALIMAIQWLIDFGSDGHIFSDSQYTVDGFHFLMQTFAVPSDWSDRDLWNEPLRRTQIHSGILTVTKIRAHLSLESPDQAAFLTFWNAVADTSAKAARLSGCSSHLSHLRAKLLSTHGWQLHWTRRSQEFLLALAQLNVQLCSNAGMRSEVQQDPEDEFISVLTDAAPNPQDWQDCFPLDLSTVIFSCPDLVSFGADLSLKFCRWLLRLDAQASYLRHVTLIEFFMGYHLCGCAELPVAGLNNSAQRVWIHMDSSHISDLVPRTLKAKLDVFAVLLGLVFGLFGCPLLKMKINKPHLGITRVVEAVQIPWPADIEQHVNCALSFYTARRPIVYARDLSRAWP
eukprot:s1011_g30.t1